MSQALALEFDATGSGVGVTVLCPDWLHTAIAESSANWPTERLGTRPADSADAAVQFMDTLFTDAVAQAPGPEAFAGQAVDAVRANRFLVLTETPLVEHALERHAEVLKGARPALPT